MSASGSRTESHTPEASAQAGNNRGVGLANPASAAVLATDREKNVVLDACVLYPPLVRGLILTAASAGFFKPIWSQRILNEWRIAAARKQGPEAARIAEAAANHMMALWPQGEVRPSEDETLALTLPDPDDAHVLAAAIKAPAKAILTFNLRDFPARVLAAHGIAAQHPDGFFWALLSSDTKATMRLIGGVLDEAGIPPKKSRQALKRARLPRLGKAWESYSNSS